MENIKLTEEQVQKLAAVQTEEELLQVMQENNMVLEDGVTAKQFLAAMNDDHSEELSADDLDSVAGGLFTPVILPGIIVVVGLGVARIVKAVRKKK